MIKGHEFNFGNKTLVIPPLSLGAVEQYEDDFAGFMNYTTIQQVKFVINMVHTSLKRNYPEITREEVAELVDFENMPEIMSIVCAQSGLISKNDGSVGNNTEGK